MIHFVVSQHPLKSVTKLDVNFPSVINRDITGRNRGRNQSMAKVIWSPLARDNLKLIYEYISEDYLDLAKTFIQKIVERTKKLSVFPSMGRIVPELQEPSIREIIFKRYRIIYHYDDMDVKISTIIHSKQDFYTAFRKT